MTRVSSMRSMPRAGQLLVEPGRLGERRDAHEQRQAGAGEDRAGSARACSSSGSRPAATALTQRARLALPGEKRTSQPSTQRCCGGALALRPASSTRDSSAGREAPGFMPATLRASARAAISRANSRKASAPLDAGSNTTPGMP